MIYTKTDLNDYLNADFSRYSVSLKSNHYILHKIKRMIHYILGTENEEYQVLRYITILRYYEYYLNNSSNNYLHRVLSKVYSLKHKYWSKKYRIYISPNIVGKGLYIPHFLGGILCNCVSIGNNCIISSGVVIGNKGGQHSRPTIGDNVELCVGCKVIGKIHIGDNVIVAPNSVCIKDVPNNAVVSGVPAQIIKFRK